MTKDKTYAASKISKSVHVDGNVKQELVIGIFRDNRNFTFRSTVNGNHYLVVDGRMIREARFEFSFVQFSPILTFVEQTNLSNGTAYIYENGKFVEICQGSRIKIWDRNNFAVYYGSRFTGTKIAKKQNMWHMIENGKVTISAPAGIDWFAPNRYATRSSANGPWKLFHDGAHVCTGYDIVSLDLERWTWKDADGKHYAHLTCPYATHYMAAAENRQVHVFDADTFVWFDKNNEVHFVHNGVELFCGLDIVEETEGNFKGKRLDGTWISL